MKIQYLGHSCFALTASAGTTVVTDPYGNVGFSMPKIKADAVTVSHSHYDHNHVNAVGGKPVVFDREGQFEAGGIEITAIKSYHDDRNGSLRGENLIFKFRIDGIEVCHMGDLGENCSAALIGKLLPVNVLLIPVGGNYTIDARQAKEYVDRIKPAYVIPMHYKTPGLNVDIEKADDFIKLFAKEDAERLGKSEIELTSGDITEDQTKIILMERQKI